MRPEIGKATAPVWIVGPQTGVVIHQLGSSETFIHSTGARAKKFDFVDPWFPHSYTPSTIAEHMRFFDHWLKALHNAAPARPPLPLHAPPGTAAHSLSPAPAPPPAPPPHPPPPPP